MPVVDYTKYRTTGVVPYTLNAIIGRVDHIDYSATTTMTVTSGSWQLVPPNPLGRRNHLKVINTGGTVVSIVTASGMAATSGYLIPASNGEWEDSTTAQLYIVSTGASSTVKVYERAER